MTTNTDYITRATIEHTDLFSGEANYSWCTRAEIEADGLTNRQVVQRLKKIVGLEGVRATKNFDTGDMSMYKIVGACQCFFITFEY